MDTSDASITIAGTYRTGTASASGDKIAIGALLRLEANMNNNSYRLTVRAVHKDVSLALKNCIKMILT